MNARTIIRTAGTVIASAAVAGVIAVSAQGSPADAAVSHGPSAQEVVAGCESRISAAIWRDKLTPTSGQYTPAMKRACAGMTAAETATVSRYAVRAETDRCADYAAKSFYAGRQVSPWHVLSGAAAVVRRACRPVLPGSRRDIARRLERIEAS